MGHHLSTLVSLPNTSPIGTLYGVSGEVGHTFPDDIEFHDVVYLMSIAGRFRYCFKRNSMKHVTVVCTVNEVLGNSLLVQLGN
ncbi:hypothetical protein CK203_110569 [Vitis vinifera]|uniref:Uncharacterized protein n=1 Tax=Vitis vinifera TaxID=29760 RepID=A0A438CFF6_VITVI|nr:hypothetical protein CK203_110569 [Vitis vinifera]